MTDSQPNNHQKIRFFKDFSVFLKKMSVFDQIWQFSPDHRRRSPALGEVKKIS